MLSLTTSSRLLCDGDRFPCPAFYEAESFSFARQTRKQAQAEGWKVGVYNDNAAGRYRPRLDFCPVHAQHAEKLGRAKSDIGASEMDAFRDILHANVSPDEATGCLRWVGPLNYKGYGDFKLNEKHYPAHRIAYQVWIGPIPAGLEIDHVYERGCRHRDCVNPAHLEAVTHRDNILPYKSRITHCPQGHAYAGDNVSISSRGHRVCVACKKARVECQECGRSVTRQHLSRHRRNVHSNSGRS